MIEDYDLRREKGEASLGDEPTRQVSAGVIDRVSKEVFVEFMSKEQTDPEIIL